MYARATVQKIARTFMGLTPGREFPIFVAKWLVPAKDVLRAGKPLGPGWSRVPPLIWRAGAELGLNDPPQLPDERVELSRIGLHQ